MTTIRFSLSTNKVLDFYQIQKENTQNFSQISKILLNSAKFEDEKVEIREKFETQYSVLNDFLRNEKERIKSILEKGDNCQYN